MINLYHVPVSQNGIFIVLQISTINSIATIVKIQQLFAFKVHVCSTLLPQPSCAGKSIEVMFKRGFFLPNTMHV